MPEGRNTKSSRPQAGAKPGRNSDDSATAGRSRKEDRIRKSAAKAGEHKEWGGVARRGAAWMDREGPGDYVEPERTAPKNSRENWVREDAPKKRASSQKKTERKRVDVSEEAVREVTKLAGSQAPRMLRYLEQAASAYAGERWRDAERAMKPLLDNIADAPVVTELHGLIMYRTGKWARAIEDLEAARIATNSDQLLPAIMDCYRARKKYDYVEELWVELKEASPDAETMADGRIVAASSIAEAGNVDRAIVLLESAPKVKGKVRYHHLRIWYVLADLYEKAGDVQRARQLFKQVASHDPDLADVLDRIETLA